LFHGHFYGDTLVFASFWELSGNAMAPDLTAGNFSSLPSAHFRVDFVQAACRSTSWASKLYLRSTSTTFQNLHSWWRVPRLS
jgi:hypothetical protein